MDLSRLNNDMNNLLSGSGIATIFVDLNLRILRFTPTVAQLINLIASDVGRLVGHIVSNLVAYDGMVADAQKVLDTLIFMEKQVQTTRGLWFNMQIKPYRTLENVIEGLVITFFDISEIKRIEAALENANKQLRLAVAVHDAFDAVTVHDLYGRIIACNPSAVRFYGWSEEESLLMNVRYRSPEDSQQECLADIARISQSAVLEPYRARRITKAGNVVNAWVTATPLVDASGKVYTLLTTERVVGA